MWTLDLLVPEDGEAMPPPSTNTQGGASESGGGTQAPGGKGLVSSSRGPWYLTAGDFLVGRKAQSCQVVLKDKGASREAARITVRPLAENEVATVGALQEVSLTDLGSRLGTRVNDEAQPLEPNTPRLLKAGDVLVFPGARFRLRHQPVVLCASNVGVKEKTALKEAAAKAGAHLAGKWGPTCTHLVVDTEATATLKVAMAVVQGKPVVDLRWLTEGVLARRERKPHMPLPDPARYAPGWGKVVGVQALGTPRTQHFKGVRFVFAAKDEAEELVRLAGAAVERAYLWDAAQQADPKAALAALGNGGRGGAIKMTVVVDPEQAATRALVDAVARVVDGVTIKHRVASSLFSMRGLRDKDDAVIEPTTPAPVSPDAKKGKKRKEDETGLAAETATTAEPTPPPSAAKGGAKGKAKAAAAAAEAEAEQEEEPAAAAATAAAPVASPSRSTRRSTRTGTPAAAEKGAEEEAEPEAPGTHPNETPASARATRSRGAAAAVGASGSTAPPTPAWAAPATSTRKRGRKVAEEEGDGEPKAAAADPASPSHHSKRVAKGKEEDQQQQQKEVAAAMEQEAEAPAAAVASPTPSASKRKAPGRARAAVEEPAQQQEQEQEQEKDTPSKRPRRGRSSQSQDDEASIPADQIPAASAAAAAAAAPAPAAKPFTIRAPPPPRPAKPLNPAEGWMVAPHAAPARPPATGDAADAAEGEGEEDALSAASPSQRSEARGRRRQEDGGEGGEDEEGPIDGTTVVEERDLLGSVYGQGGSIFTYYWQPPPGQGGGLGSPAAAGGAGRADGDGRPNFKRFRKNRVRGVTDGDGADGEGAGVPVRPRRVLVEREDLIAVLPKESEMELRLKHEEAMEMKRQEEGERLFEEEDEGPRRRKKR